MAIDLDEAERDLLDALRDVALAITAARASRAYEDREQEPDTPVETAS